MISSNMKTVTAIAMIGLFSFAFLGACGKPKDSTADGAANIKETVDADKVVKPPDTAEATGEAITVNLTIGGMHCENCVNTLTRALGECPGVTSAVVDLEGEKAEVKGVGIDPQALVTAVAKRGYTAEVVK